MWGRLAYSEVSGCDLGPFHGIFKEDEAVTVFAAPLYKAYADPDHSAVEDRFIAIGQSLRSRILVVYKYQAERTRIISAREATRGERHSYEENEIP